MSNRIAVFDDGIIQQLATPEELYERPQNAFVAQFIGENNKLLGTVEELDGDNCAVRTEDGSLIQSLAVNIPGKGGKTTLSLRPERVTVEPAEGSCPNVFQGQVKELIYLGDHIRTRVDICGHDDFIVKMPNAAGHQNLSVGSMVKVGWQAADCRALDA